MEIDIPRVLVHLRGRVVEHRARLEAGEGGHEGALPRLRLAPRLRGRPAGRARLGARRWRAARRVIARLPWPLSGWTETRDLPAPPARDLPRLVEARARRRARAPRVDAPALPAHAPVTESRSRRPPTRGRGAILDADRGRAGGPPAAGGGAARLPAPWRAHPRRGRRPLRRARRRVPRHACGARSAETTSRACSGSSAASAAPARSACPGRPAGRWRPDGVELVPTRTCRRTARRRRRRPDRLRAGDRRDRHDRARRRGRARAAAR